MSAIAKSILYSVGVSSSGQLVKALDAQKGLPYSCPVCEQVFILRKGTKKRPHFAHKTLTPNCTPETALHYGFKTLLCKRIQEFIDLSLPLNLQWNCSTCGGSHTGNLLKKATQVKLEHNLGRCQSDIALLDKNGHVIAVIEVVVTHAPEQAALGYYRQNHIAVVLFELKSDEDIARVDESVLKPDSVNKCRNPKCSNCKRHMSKQKMLIIEGDCWKCGAPMKVAALRGDLGYEGSFSQEDAQLATQHGVYMRSQHSRTMRTRYFASTCRRCKAFVGEHYLFRDYVAVLEYKSQEIEAGYYCPHCH